jgi:hypothetical protein
VLVDGLLIPERLVAAVAAGRWPRTAEEASRQNSRCLVPEERIRSVAPEESKIYLYAPPFHTVANILSGLGADFYRKFGAVDQLVPEVAVEIADFGLGADSPILLDYRASTIRPCVIRLSWPGDGTPNRWVVLTADFTTFIDALGL